MEKEKKERVTAASSWYKQYKRKLKTRYRLSWFYLFGGIIVSFLLLMLILGNISTYKESKEQLAELTNERSARRAEIQNAVTDEQVATFEKKQTELADGWSSNEDNYSVKVNNKELAINRNNIFVSDNANVLKDKTKQKIYQMNKEFSQFNDGQQLMVVTIQSLPSHMTIESFASDVFNRLGIGQKDEKNGILYVMSIDDRKTRIEVGYGLESTVTDAQAGAMLEDDDTVEDFKDEAYDKGVNRILDQLYLKIGSLTPEYDAQIKNTEEELTIAKTGSIVFAVGIFLCLIGSILFFIETIKLKKKSDELSEKDSYYLYLAAPAFLFTVRRLRKMIATGKVMSNHPGATRQGTTVLVGNHLYDSNGYTITRDYASYNSSSGSGSSGGSFGGGSSGGGGASGGW